MSELNVYHHELRPDEYDEFYLKYEADKVIALLKDKANYNEYAYKHKSEEFADTCRFYEKELRHHKYKRCLAMAMWCLTEKVYCHYRDDDWWDRGYDRPYKWKKVVFWSKWAMRWLELAEKFKEEK